MRTLVHLSDLHFGRTHAQILAPLLTETCALRPDLVVISGDLTQRARSDHFREARAFLDVLPSPQIVVPGNHDVPLWNPIGRFFGGLSKYRRCIGEDLEPFFADDEIAVLGLNTARRFVIVNGRLSHVQIGHIRDRMGRLGGGVIKMVVTHHPFDVPEGSPHAAIVGRAALAMGAVADCCVDAILSGHLHVAHVGRSAERFAFGARSALLIQAGTTTSTRGRGEPNSFNVIHAGSARISVERRTWRDESRAFEASAIDRYEKAADGWKRAL